MATRVKTIRHLFNGGWATDYGPTAEVQVGPDGFLRIPYLLKRWWTAQGRRHGKAQQLGTGEWCRDPRRL
ncbi:hypothetical protein AMJ82_11250 [candidate division TA06 bacterium SM23_40]|uniref:Uncharacterized protein n=1 Tax=candidate division TA06 bacterium SM23_40 TaxID=1703774 RepID=A0A0S8G3I0_UNCT6|nr:MAG: hypothetical protein AMJ82_11250 [candidate division TA06 bacterium SM23_40]